MLNNKTLIGPQRNVKHVLEKELDILFGQTSIKKNLFVYSWVKSVEKHGNRSIQLQILAVPM